MTELRLDMLRGYSSRKGGIGNGNQRSGIPRSRTVSLKCPK
jgi:hypothetical protein